MSRYFKAALCLVACVSSIAVGSLRAEDSAPDPHTRLGLETKELYRFIKSSELAPKKERCSADSNWVSYAIPAGIAREQLGLRAHNDVTPIYQNISPAAMLDLGDGYQNSYCNKQEFESYGNEKHAKFKASSEKYLRFSKIGFSLPVFNASFTKAIIIRIGEGSFWYRKDAGISGEVEFAVSAVVYTKFKDRWTQTDIIRLLIA